MAEIESNFQTFDKDKSNKIDKKELKACLYSLGEEKKKTEIDAIMTKHGQDGKMSAQQFKVFMIGVYGDTESPDEIKKGFKVINRGEEFTVVEKMEFVMEDEDVAYIKKTAKPQGTGYNYQAWTDDMFSR